MDYSVFSLIDDILAHGCSNQEDPRIKLLQEGLERDAANICARLLNHNPASASVSAWALGFAQATLMIPSPWNNNISPGGSSLPSGIAWTSTGGPERFLNMGRVLFKLVKNYRYGVTIDMLPDNVLLEIFDFFLRDPTMSTIDVIQHPMKWQILVHVCQRWRRVIFESPRRLDLHLSCSYGTPVRRNLDFWPVTLPLAVDYPFVLPRLSPEDEDNIIAALGHASRVHRIDILASGPLIRKVAVVMQKSFPALTHLDLGWDLNGAPPVIPKKFLAGSAPRLRYFRLGRVSFPQLPTLLLSARNLITLKVKDISQNGYISPEAMVESLAVLTRLRTLSIALDEKTSSPSDQMRSRPDPPLRTILPALTTFHYRGYSEYLEDILAQIDTPRLYDVRIEYFTHEVQAPELSRFADRTENLKPDQFSRAEVSFYSDVAYIELDCPRGGRRQARLALKILDQEWLDMQVSCIVQVLDQLVPMFSYVDHLDAHGDHVYSRGMDITDWLPFFRLFPAVQTLHLSGGVAAYIVSALEDTADPEETVTDVFPALRLIWLDEAIEDEDEDDRNKPVGSIEQFLSLRRLSGRPVTIVDTEAEFIRRCREKVS
ncbi:hypothetical protein EDB85DRAFT_2290745 [Lactarius pseudohatsudake]|nr:hypothetical protein EDB85DRAFT_2290745 [Lactarius pseudohatsudake]